MPFLVRDTGRSGSRGAVRISRPGRASGPECWQFCHHAGQPVIRTMGRLVRNRDPRLAAAHGQHDDAADAAAEQFDRDTGANVTDLGGRFDASRYLSPHSDLVALMVLEHQTHMHNLLTAANYQARMALHDQRIMDEMLGRSGAEPSASTLRRVGNAAEKVVEGLLFSGEASLESSLKGTSDFAERFTARTA